MPKRRFVKLIVGKKIERVKIEREGNRGDSTKIRKGKRFEIIGAGITR